MAPGDIAFKSNFATLNPDTGVVEKRRADRQFEHLGPTLCAALDGATHARAARAPCGPPFSKRP
jgi:2,3-bisphosphoglycerate-independent phosphoglycerate mutase